MNLPVAMCGSRSMCGACRDRGSRGDAFRRMARVVYGTPAEPWECPHGVEWAAERSSQPVRPARSPAEQSELLAAHCDACPHQALLENDVPACRLIKSCGGRGGPCRSAFVAMLVGGKCPAEKF